MPTELVLAPVGAGKTEHVLSRIANLTAEKPFAPVWVLLATQRQVTDFRQRLIEEIADDNPLLNVEFFSFYDLYERVLNTAGQPTRKIKTAARMRLLRALAMHLADNGELAAFQAIADKSGFVDVTLTFIDELKQAVAAPEEYARAADELFAGREKDAGLARLYAAYQSRLQEHSIVDRDGEGWLALEALQADADLCSHIDLLIVDGFDQFTPLQAALIALLSKCVEQAEVTLTTVPGREEGVGRRFMAAQQALQEAHRAYQTDFTVKELTASVEGQRLLPLQHLADTIFLRDAPQRSADEAVAFLSAPHPADETAAVLRSVKDLLLAGVPADEIILAVRDHQMYGVHLQNIGRAYGLPLSFHLNELLSDIPPILVLMEVITLHDTQRHLVDFPTATLLDVLRSPYCDVEGLDAQALSVLERIAREFAVVGGATAWLDALDRAARPRPTDEDDSSQERPPLIDETVHQQLRQALTTFFEAVTPPRQASLVGYIAWLEHLIGEDPLLDPDEEPSQTGQGSVLNMIACIRREGVSPHVVSRDLTALNTLKQTLTEMLSAQALLTTLEGVSGPVSWRRFLGDLRAAIAPRRLEWRPSRSGRVLVTTATNARGLPHDYVFVLGLAEGVFPRRLREDPLYLESERQQLRRAGIRLQTINERASDDSLFYELISLARKRLTLSRPTVKNGAPWVESHLWRATQAVFTDAATLEQTGREPIGQVPALSAAATPDEVALYVADALNETVADEMLPAALAWVQTYTPQVWNNILAGRYIEAQRGDSHAPHDNYSGVIMAPALLERLQTGPLGPGHTWSASQFNDYGLCPFRFYAKRILRLEEPQQPQIGMDALQLGLLNHEILERIYSQLAAQQVQIHAPNLDMALSLLDAEAVAIETAPQRLGFRASPVWAQERDVLLRRLRALIEYDFNELNTKISKKFGASAPRYPYQTETPFGITGNNTLLTLDDGTVLPIGGYIDRIDRVGDQALVIDYKSGSSLISTKELEEGRSFQIMFYALAMRRILAAQGNGPLQDVLGGFFFHIRTPDISGLLSLSDEEHIETVERAQRFLSSYVHHARAGNFAVSPSKPAQNRRCVSYCPYHHLCRVAATHPQKPDPQR